MVGWHEGEPKQEWPSVKGGGLKLLGSASQLDEGGGANRNVFEEFVDLEREFGRRPKRT